MWVGGRAGKRWVGGVDGVRGGWVGGWEDVHTQV